MCWEPLGISEGQSYGALVCLRDRSSAEGAVGRQLHYWPFEERLLESTFPPERGEVWQFPWANLLVGQHWDAAGLLSQEDRRRNGEGEIHRPRTPGGPMNYTSDSLSLSHLVSLFRRYPPKSATERANKRRWERERKRRSVTFLSSEEEKKRGETRMRAGANPNLHVAAIVPRDNEWPSNKGWQLKLTQRATLFLSLSPTPVGGTRLIGTVERIPGLMGFAAWNGFYRY